MCGNDREGVRVTLILKNLINHMTIDIANFTRKKINRESIKRTVDNILKKVELNFNELSIVFVGDTRMKKLNKEHRGKNKVTDVLSFNYSDSGEIVICYLQARRQSKTAKISTVKELTNLLVHAILHLSGHDHEKNKKEAILMLRRQEAISRYLQVK